uniref:Enoyl-CoA hydratase n=1 Tax=Steinernema glaseri TaxID=37863 RepID=A0A1I7YRW1_9BILA
MGICIAVYQITMHTMMQQTRSICVVPKNKDEPSNQEALILLSNKLREGRLGMDDYEYIVVHTEDYVSVVQLHHREHGNTMHLKIEIYDAFKQLSVDPKTRVVIVTGDGDNFCAGIDMNGEHKELLCYLGSSEQDYKKYISAEDTKKKNEDPARQALSLCQRIEHCQKAFTAVENCPKPVIAAVQGQCIGGGFGLVTACDIRLATQNAVFVLKEMNVAVILELSHLPKITKHSAWLRKIAFTGRRFDAAEALKHCRLFLILDCPVEVILIDLIIPLGVVSKVYDSEKELLRAAQKMARRIAEKSPASVQTTKAILNFARDHKRKDTAKFGQTLNMLGVMSADVKESVKGVDDSNEMLEFDEY